MLCIYGSAGVIHFYMWCLFSSEDDTEVNWSRWKPYTGQIYNPLPFRHLPEIQIDRERLYNSIL